jgi:hypothetical protein
MPRIRVSRHIARLIARHVARLIVPLAIFYCASHRFVVDYFAYAACSGVSARRAARRATRRRLLRLCRASECLGTSRGLPCCSSSTSTTPRVWVPRHISRLVAPLVVDYFAYAVRPDAWARHAACHTARHRLLRLRHASGCLGTSRGSLSTSSRTPRVWVPRHVARLVVDYFGSRRLVVYYFAYIRHPGASARHAARRRPRVISPLDFSSVGRTGSRRAPDRSFSLLDYFVPPLDLFSSHTGSILQPRRAFTTTCVAATPALLRVRHAPPQHRLPVASC